MKVKKSVLLDIIITSIQAGKYPSEIAREQGISKQKINYYLRRLKDEGLLKKKGYGVWETNFYSNQVGRTVRGHAFMWKVKIPKHFQWKQLLESKHIKYIEQLNKTIRIMVNERKVWLGKNNIIIYEPESFFGRNAIESKKFAVLRLLTILNKIESLIGVSLKGKEGYSFKVSRQHYALIKNSLAIQCNKEGKHINVYNKKGLWFLIDNSYNLEEAETVHKESGLLDSLGIQKYFNSHKDTGFKVTPDFILTAFNEQNKIIDSVVNVQQMNADNIIKHQKVLDDMLITLKSIRDVLDKNAKVL